MVKSKENLIGAWAFLIGVVLAIIIGIVQSRVGIESSSLYSFLALILVILGLMVGFSRYEEGDSMTFLLASLTLVIVSALGQSTIMFISNISPVLSSLSAILSALLIMFIPATIIVALKTVFSITSL